MGGSGKVSRPALLQVKTMHGEPYSIGGRKLTPVVRVVSFGKARATVGTRRSGGWASGFVWIKPIAILEDTPQGGRRIAITDGTAAAVRGILGVAVTITFALAALRHVVRRSRDAKLV